MSQVAKLKLQIQTLKATMDARRFGSLPEEAQRGFGAWVDEEAILHALERQLARIEEANNRGKKTADY